MAAAAAGDARATICFVAPPELKDEFLSGAVLLSAFKLHGAFESSLLQTFYKMNFNLIRRIFYIFLTVNHEFFKNNKFTT